MITLDLSPPPFKLLPETRMNLLSVVFYIQLALCAALFLMTYLFVARNGQLKKEIESEVRNRLGQKGS